MGFGGAGGSEWVGSIALGLRLMGLFRYYTAAECLDSVAAAHYGHMSSGVAVKQLDKAEVHIVGQP